MDNRSRGWSEPSAIIDEPSRIVATRETRFSLIINNYNHGQFLRDAIHTYLAQNHNKRDVIVVGDGSTDKLVELIRFYGKD